MKSFGTFLKYARKQSNLTQEQVAERLNIVTPVLSKWENDKAVPSLDMLCKLCNALNISIEESIAAEISEAGRELPPEQYAPEKLGETIKDLRIKNGWSQADVGKKLFVTSQTVSKWESGGISSLEVLGKLAELFGLSPTELLNGLNRAKPATGTPPKETPEKRNGFKIKAAAIALSVIIFFSAGTGLIIGLSNNGKGDGQTAPDSSQSDDEQPDDETNPAFCLPMQSEIYRFHGDKHLDDLGAISGHKGLDFSAEVGDKVYAVADGIIEKIYIQASTNYCFIRIDHGDGLISLYLGVVPADYLEEGSSVKKGDIIAAVSEVPYFNEDYDGPHLHFSMVYNGIIVNPLDYIPYNNGQT